MISRTSVCTRRLLERVLIARWVQVIGCKPILVPAAGVLDAVFRGHPVLLLFFVMIMCPMTMNILQVNNLLLVLC